MSSTVLGGGPRGARARSGLLESGRRLLPLLERVAERLSRRAPELALVTFGVVLRVKAVQSYWYGLGYDFGAHEANVLWWSQQFKMPPLELSRGSYHPQLYYVIGGLLLRLTRDMLSVQLLSAFTGCVRLLVLWWAAERYLSDRVARIFALALAVGMPVALEMDAIVTQESMNNLLALIFLIGVLKLCAAPDGRRFWPALGVGVLAGLGLLLKMSNFVLLGLLGVAHMRLGHFRAARHALERALRLAPDDVAVLHNLGHLLDVAFDRPEEALPHLALACRIVPDEPAIASSHAHALARTGQEARAEQLLVRSARLSPGLAQATIAAWTGHPSR